MAEEVGLTSNHLRHLRGGTEAFWFAAAPGAPRQEVVLRDGRLVLLTDSGTRVLRGDVARLRITYFGRRTVRSAEGWAEEWKEAMILPRLIRIEAWDAGGVAHPPLALRPALRARQSEISASSPLPPG